MKSIRPALLIICLSILYSCASSDVLRPQNNLYCDRFLIYDMCSRDIDEDGVLEFVYFEDDMQIFMYREGAQPMFPDEMPVHVCAQPMDEELVATTSRVFYVNDETGIIEKTDIKGAMMLKYIAYLPRVASCQMEAEAEAEAENAEQGN